MGGTGGMMGADGMPPNMADMMNNPMVQEMMNNPEMLKMAQQMMMGGAQGGGGGAMPDPNKMQEMMQNPSLAKLVDNPDFLHTTVQMLKQPMARPQVEQIAKQTGMAPETMIKVLEFLVNCAYGMKRVKSFFTNPIIKYGLMFFILSLILKWMGFTQNYLFMVPVKHAFRAYHKGLENDDDDNEL